MSREKKIQFNVNEKEYERLKSHAESEGLSMAEVLRDYIKTLTPPKGGRITTTSHKAHALQSWDVVDNGFLGSFFIVNAPLIVCN
ncbi:ribbon-helix-helix domain-containing protein [Planktothrix prolifica]|uniref:ribbon-helix-helix domain-containing protein n=1 Tax=Planktothrix prolifica TaxID=54307 RepID=UPI0005C60307|nr:ribbon-helix-helix domain-containing protein [Planktothrix prolifica]